MIFCMGIATGHYGSVMGSLLLKFKIAGKALWDLENAEIS
jgi:hypothetical protein